MGKNVGTNQFVWNWKKKRKKKHYCTSRCLNLEIQDKNPNGTTLRINQGLLSSELGAENNVSAKLPGANQQKTHFYCSLSFLLLVFYALDQHFFKQMETVDVWQTVKRKKRNINSLWSTRCRSLWIICDSCFPVVHL